MTHLVTISPDIQSGEAVFAGTRVPVKNFFDYLRGGDSLDDFLKDFPSVRREQALRFLSLLPPNEMVRTIDLRRKI